MSTQSNPLMESRLKTKTEKVENNKKQKNVSLKKTF